MKPQSYAETLLQAVIIAACLLIIYFTYFVGGTGAQSCAAIPPLYTDRDPVTWSWPLGKQVSFFIDDQWTNNADRQAFTDGIKKWNDWNAYNCSSVTFIAAGTKHFTDYAAPAPDSTVYRQKTDRKTGGTTARSGPTSAAPLLALSV